MLSIVAYAASQGQALAQYPHGNRLTEMCLGVKAIAWSDLVL